MPSGIDGSTLSALLRAAERDDERALLESATRALIPELGERASCLLTSGKARVVCSTQTPDLTNWPIDLKRYPEVVAALDEREIVAVEDAHSDKRLDGVRDLIPSKLGS